MKIDQVDVNSLPAYAVYQNLIPGVKVYQDTNQVSNKRKERKRKADVKRESNGNVAGNGVKTVVLEEPKKKRRKNKKKKEGQGGMEVNGLANGSTASTKSVQAMEPSKVTKKVVVGDAAAKPDTKKAKKKMHQQANGKVTESVNGSVANGKGVKNVKKDKMSGKQKEQHEQEKGKKQEVGEKVQEKGKAMNKKVKQQIVAFAEARSKKKSKAGENVGVEEAPAIPLRALMNSQKIHDSVSHGKDMFQWLIHPVPVKKFMNENWEKAPLYLKRSDVDPDYYKWILSSAKLDDIMRRNVIRFGKNIDITSYTDGQRETHNPVGRAVPAAVWDYYANGCSVRFLNPQTYSKPLWRLNAILQEYFGTFVGANVYLTPPDTQGFAPHYDDIEAFILQLEGKKHWKVYKPRNANEDLARLSSPNFSEDTDNIGEPVLDVVLEEGDLLYFPRGYIHQGKAVGEHSLHVTLSCYQLNSWGDMLKEYFSAAVDSAMATNVEFRKGLPIGHLSYMGLAHEGSKKKLGLKKRKKFMKHMKTLVKQLVDSNSPDDAVDQMAKKTIWDSLPPYLTEEEKETTSVNDGEFMQEGEVFNRCEMDPDVEVKLVRKNCVRLVSEENAYRLYFTLENSMEYHGEEAQFVEIPPESLSAMKHLIRSYPNYVKIEDLPIDDLTVKIQLVADLWEKGILSTKQPLAPAEDDADFVTDDEEDEDEEGENLSDDDMFDEEDEDNDDYSDGFDEFIDDRDIEYYDDEDDEEGDYSDRVVEGDDDGAEYSDDEYGEEASDYSDYSGDSQTTEDSLGKSFIEEVNSDDEADKNSSSEDDDETAPALVSASPSVKKGKR